MNHYPELKPEYYFELSSFEHAALFRNVHYVWEVLPLIKTFIQSIKDNYSRAVAPADVYFKGSDIFVAEDVIIEPGVYIAEPCIIGPGCVIRHGAYLRGNIILGNNALVGHASEVKNSVFLNGAKAPHFNYVGDSILGNNVNLGAGTKLSNVKITLDDVTVRFESDSLTTGLRKFGAILGDRVQTGCNSVLNPGCILGPDSMVYPNTTATGFYKGGTIVKPSQQPRTLLRRGLG